MEISTPIHIEKEDIKAGRPGKPGLCPIAIAVNRKMNSLFNDFKYSEILPGSATLYWKEKMVYIHLPQEAKDFIRLFDGDRFEPEARTYTPFTFMLTFKTEEIHSRGGI